MTLFVTPVLLAVILQVPMPPQPSAPDVVALSQAVHARAAAGEFASVEERFTDQMKAAMPPGRMAELWKSLVTQVGAHKSCEPKPRVVAIADKQMVITPCDFERARIDIQLAFDSAGRISGMAMRPAAAATAPYALPAYATPSAYTEAAMTVGSGEWTLPATLTLPVGTKPVPAVILVHGSGPNDRDETVGANKPFKDLALGLASRGIAVLRYDKRTKVHGAKLAAASSFTVKQEVVDDVLEALKTLRANRRIDAARIYVLGHSLGGMLVPRIAAADPSMHERMDAAGVSGRLEAPDELRGFRTHHLEQRLDRLEHAGDTAEGERRSAEADDLAVIPGRETTHDVHRIGGRGYVIEGAVELVEALARRLRHTDQTTITRTATATQ